MDYILSEKKYFQSYIEGGKSEIVEYCKHKKQVGVWGDDLELQAIREIYNIPIEVYAYSCKPMKTFHENKDEEDK